MGGRSLVATTAAGLLAIVALVGAALPFAFASRPPASRDYYAIWGLKARHLRGPAPSNVLTSPALRRSHLDYPLLYPLLLVAVGAEGETPAPSRANLVGAVAALLTALACGLSLRGRVPAPLLLGTVALVAWRPVLTQEGLLGMAEPLLCLFLTVGALVGAWGLETGRRSAVGLAALSFALAAVTKNEGLPPALAFLAVAAATTAADPGAGRLHRLRRALAPLLPALLVVGGWQVVKWGHAAGSEYLRADRWGQLGALPGAAAESIRLVARTTWVSPETGALLFGALALAAAPQAVGPRFRLVVASSAGLHLLALLTVYALTPYDRAWHVATSAIRLLSVWTPLALVAVARAWSGEPK